ncbi:MAG: hypothetical protein ACREO5_03350, partial [Candidatus Binatia bacterium]
HSISYYSVDNAGNIESEQLEYFTVTESFTPKSIKPVIECVEPAGGLYRKARFGYINLNAEAVTIPVGDGNKFSDGDSDRGQTTTFQSGEIQNVFEVRYIDNFLTWTLTGPDGVSQSITTSRKIHYCEE